MLIQFNRNIQFSKLVKANGRLREFNFRRVNGIAESLFTVDVSDDRGYRIMFKMKKEADHWKIVEDPLPIWIRDNEGVFHELIEEELRYGS
jgi:hypothetical protein